MFGMPIPNYQFNNGFFVNNNNGMGINNNMTQMPMNQNFNYYNNMGINTSMNMNMFNLMMFYLQQNMNQNNNNNNTNRIIPVMPDGNLSKSQALPRKKNEFFDPYPGTSGEKMNLFFETPAGHKVNMLVPADAKMKDILVQYVLKLNLGPDVIENSIYFLYGGKKIKKNENRTVRQMNILNGAIVIVIDKKGIMGA